MDKKFETILKSKEFHRITGELTLKLAKLIYREIKDKKKGRKVIAKAGGRKVKKK